MTSKGKKKKACKRKAKPKAKATKRKAKAGKGAVEADGIDFSAKTQQVRFGAIKPYTRNPRINDDAVAAVKESIRRYGYLVPIVVDKAMDIVAGHTRYKAMKELGIKKDTEVGVIDARNLTEAQIRAFRIADNKSHEFAQWDFQILSSELSAIQAMGEDIEATLFNEDDLRLMDVFGEEFKRGGEGEGFSDLVDKFGEGNTGKTHKDEKWFYFEFYGDEKRYKKIFNLLKAKGIIEKQSVHQLDPDKTYDLLVEVLS